ncbi:hypothetical protein LTR70_008874 [Exophiala xenobiotica]|uniref:Uncharacterized protein n=1 Tax=Lithohypha guttulata TaxID=1690604 RepID=A0ABR0JZS4_9EURO|nr:hypothetical protein LTR24_008536 [Lithohypha guttulata]KAK5311338.1 hypothetical protein LTR70_008874 [Exophiala xenobiotica]
MWTLLVLAYLPVALPIPISPASTTDCTRLILDSTSSTFDWTSPAALELAQDCLLSSTPPKDTCVFYTSGDRDNAIRFATQFDKRTIYDVYPPRHFDKSLYLASQWYGNGHLRSVFRVTSRAYAISCSGAAALVTPKDEKSCLSSIWWTDEYDAIKNRISKITELSQASLVGKVDGVWQWLIGSIGKMAVEGAQVSGWEASVESAEGQGQEKSGWKRMLVQGLQGIALQAVGQADDIGSPREKSASIEGFGTVAEEWAVAVVHCGLRKGYGGPGSSVGDLPTAGMSQCACV